MPHKLDEKKFTEDQLKAFQAIKERIPHTLDCLKKLKRK